MKVLTAEQMRYLDTATIEQGTPGLDLMRTAGNAVYDFIVESLEIDSMSRIVVLAGTGNNGGDGFRIAEMLVANGYRASVLLVGEQNAITGDAQSCMNAAVAAGASIEEVLSDSDLDDLSETIENADIIVDALFGTGLRGEITGIASDVISFVNDTESVIIAVDIPSGVNATTGEVAGSTVQADYTVTFGCLKTGLVMLPGKLACGDVSVVDIGLSEDILVSIQPFANSLSSVEAAELMPVRLYDAHKGLAGKVFILAGSVGKTGAAALSARAAMRAGAGLVTLGCPESLNDILEVKLTEEMTLPLPEVRKKRCLSLRAMGMIRKQLREADVMAVGPGLGTYYETSDLVVRLLSDYTGKVVLDADGINAFAGKADMLADMPCDLILTPHPGELSRLMDESVAQILSDPITAVRNAAERTGKTVVLKGATTLICNADGSLWINSTGNEALATGGTGDVLTGIIAGIAAQGLDMFEAAVLGVYLHGLAGEAASEEKGVYGMIAGDMLEKIPGIIVDLITEKNV